MTSEILVTVTGNKVCINNKEGRKIFDLNF